MRSLTTSDLTLTLLKPKLPDRISTTKTPSSVIPFLSPSMASE
eukprot:CAMPEP_0118648410 /NCGR_PEP_ID=MMETSP0785-20121206/9140_1 /TAXON_ID=91992 /ORGANISM="Bolidomonas pacifica, Strain CCMP 1866" /LENGTH=42 /DNA_ID= /DNA_START= /DNA_END= /DNA_ORIENTATION=